MTWASMSSTTAASQYSQRKSAKPARTWPQSVRQATRVSKMALTPNRNSLFSNDELLFVGFRPRLIKPTMLFLDHVYQEAKTSRARQWAQHERDGHGCPRRHFPVKPSAPAFRHQSRAVTDLGTTVHARQRSA